MSIRDKITYGSEFYQNHNILWNILRFFLNWKCGVQFRYRMLINNSLGDSLYYRLNRLFWNIFYPLGCLKDILKRLYYRLLHKGGNIVKYLQYKFSKKEPELPVDKELAMAIDSFTNPHEVERIFIEKLIEVRYNRNEILQNNEI